MPNCSDCKVDVSGTIGIGEYAYMIDDRWWERAWEKEDFEYEWGFYKGKKIKTWADAIQSNSEQEEKQSSRFLCIKCLEKRLGKRLAKWYFTDCPLNSSTNFTRSKLLQSRMKNTEWKQRMARNVNDFFSCLALWFIAPLFYLLILFSIIYCSAAISAANYNRLTGKSITTFDMIFNSKNLQINTPMK